MVMNIYLLNIMKMDIKYTLHGHEYIFIKYYRDGDINIHYMGMNIYLLNIIVMVI